ncbi:MAG TPA: type 1 glutamine amidotransferase domain-containing protein [Steroidobacteraceae bacterium]
MSTLSGMKVAILVADGFEQVEMTDPRKALDEAGAQTRIVSPAKGQVQGWKHYDRADRFEVDVPLQEAEAEDFDALLLPGGVANPDQLRITPRAVQFVHSFFETKKPVAVICHGPWTLVEADVVRGRAITSWPSVKTDLVNAGARWTDQEVVVDDGLISSRKPADIPAFNRRMIEEFAKAVRAAPSTSRSTSKGTQPGARG